MILMLISECGNPNWVAIFTNQHRHRSLSIRRTVSARYPKGHRPKSTPLIISFSKKVKIRGCTSN